MKIYLMILYSSLDVRSPFTTYADGNRWRVWTVLFFWVAHGGQIYHVQQIIYRWIIYAVLRLPFWDDVQDL